MNNNYLGQNALLWILDMILSDEIRLKDIPVKIRVSQTEIYVTAFRISRVTSCKRFIKDLTILCNDIYILDESHFNKIRLIETLSSNLSMNEFIGDEEYENFLQIIPEKILRDMSGNDEVVRNNIKKQLEEQNLI